MASSTILTTATSVPLLPLHTPSSPAMAATESPVQRRRRPRRALSIASSRQLQPKQQAQQQQQARRFSTSRRGVARSSTFHPPSPLPLTQTQVQAHTTTTTPLHPPLARIHSGSAVAGFVVGTTFEAALMGWLAFLHVYQVLNEDPLLFYALLAFFLTASWSGVFHFVLRHMDVLLEMVPSALPLYSHFLVGMALGLGLEWSILHHVLHSRGSHTAALLISQPQGILGMVSILFGMGCVGLTFVRSYYRIEKKVLKRDSKRVSLLSVEGMV